MDPITLGALAASFLVTFVALRHARTRRRRQRRVELPNSHYTSQMARNREVQHRWKHIVLDRVHEVNREEVRRLLAKVEATSVEALRPAERTFLDRIAELAGTAPPAHSDDDAGDDPSGLHPHPA